MSDGEKTPCVYILASGRNGTLYTGVTSDLKGWRRAWKIRLIESMNPEWIDLLDECTGTILDGPADLARRLR